MTEHCDCPLGGPCKKFGFVGRRADICKGIVLTPEACEKYRATWVKLGGTKLKRVLSFIEEHVKWVAAGCPTRTEAELEVIMQTCLDCEHVKPGATIEKSVCSLCGCTCRKRGTLKNKAAMATANCPIGKW